MYKYVHYERYATSIQHLKKRPAFILRYIRFRRSRIVKGSNFGMLYSTPLKYHVSQHVRRRQNRSHLPYYLQPAANTVCSGGLGLKKGWGGGHSGERERNYFRRMQEFRGTEVVLDIWQKNIGHSLTFPPLQTIPVTLTLTLTSRRGSSSFELLAEI